MHPKKDINIFIAMPMHYQKAFMGKEAEERLSSFANVHKNRTPDPLSEPELSAFIKDADGVIVGWGDNGLSKKNLEDARKLRIIGVIGASVKKVQPELAFKKEITIVNTAKMIGNCVAEHTLAFMLSWLRRIVYFDKRMKAGEFSEKSWNDISVTSSWNVGSYLTEKEIGIVGMGIIGKRLVELLRPFRVKIRAHSPHFPKDEANSLGVELTTLEEVLRCSDIISVHAGLREGTFHLIGKKELNLMREGAILINTARGSIVDERALTSILKQKKIYAALDVYSEEPLPRESSLRELENVILTPHIAGPHIGGYSKEIHKELGLSIAKDFELFFSEEIPLNALGKERVRTMT